MKNVTIQVLLALAVLVCFVAATATCPPDCSGHGTRTVSGSCQCAAGFTGNECQFESKPHTPGHCSATGDPHYTTFSGAYYSYQGTGIYWVVQTADHFGIQSWVKPYLVNANVMVNDAIYVQFIDTFVTISAQATNALQVNANGQVFNLLSTASENTNVQVGHMLLQTKHVSGVTSFNFAFAGFFSGELRAANVTVSVVNISSGTKKQTYFNMNYYLSEQWKNRVSGMCDRYDGTTRSTVRAKGANSDIAVSNAAGIKNQFGPSWRVDCLASGFTGMARTDCLNPPVAHDPPTCDMIETAAESICQLACNDYAQCMTDVHASCSLDAANQHVTAYELIRTTKKYDQCGGGWCTPCSGHGTCNNGQCTCETGYTGVQCQNSPTNLPCPNDCSNHGVCSYDGVCHCHSGWGGANCATVVAPLTCPGGCGTGTCNDGICVCPSGKFGVNCQLTVPCSPHQGLCHATGDPHYVSFDNHAFDYQADGVFYMIHSSELMVQSHHIPYRIGPTARLNHAIGIQYRGTTVEFYAGADNDVERIRYSGQTLTHTSCFSKVASNGYVQVGGLRIYKNGGGIIVRFGTTYASYIQLNLGISGTQRYLDFYSVLDNQFFGQTRGLCGTWDLTPSNDFLPRFKTVAGALTAAFLAATHGPSWQVPLHELFLTQIAPSACTVVPAPVVIPNPGPCALLDGMAQQICSGACTNYAQCITDVNAGCDVRAAKTFLELEDILNEIGHGTGCVRDLPICLNSCSNNGVCVSDGNCHCNDGFTGEDCSVKECDCNGHGDCVDGVCCCQTWWTGAHCDTPACGTNGCGHGSCTGPSSCTCLNDATNGHWTKATATGPCDTCAAGWSGSDCKTPVCTGGCGHGSCSAPGVCTCTNDHSGHWIKGASGKCDTCAAGWSGATCLTPVCTGGCGHGTCTAPETCTCTDGPNEVPVISNPTVSPHWTGPGHWTGAKCNACKTGFQGASCNIPVCSGCHDSVCVAPNTCKCDFAGYDFHFVDSACSACAHGWSGFLCQTPVCSSACAHGSCTAPDTCTCEPQFTGPTCSQCIAGFTGPTCTTPVCEGGCGDGTCTAPGVCQCNDHHFAGLGCSSCAVGFSGSGCLTPLCPGGCGGGLCTEPNVCTCHSDATSGYFQGTHCDTCQHGWSGSACLTPVCTNCQHGTCTLPEVCTCTVSNVEGHWKGAACDSCVSGWEGESCNTAICTQGCSHGTCTQPNVCECVSGSLANGFWQGADCNSCIAPYTGPHCDIIPCPADCSGHGVCDNAGSCTCDNNYIGLDCATFEPNLAQLSVEVMCRLPGPDVLPGSTAAIVFATSNENTIEYTIPYGIHNYFTTGSADREQPTVFGLGETASFPEGGVVVPFESSETSLTWVLGDSSATGTTSTPLCVVPCPNSECGGNGQCIVGTCICDSGFIGAGCEQDLHLIVPTVGCMIEHFDNSRTFQFTVVNSNDMEIVLPVGPTNSFAPGLANNGQPTIFPAGSSQTFSFVSREASVTWTIGANTATSDTNSAQCDLPCPGDCNGHGFCDGGNCVCQDGWTTEDCNTVAPLLTKVIPTLQCVEHLCPSCVYSAVFSYINNNEDSVDIPVGVWNTFTPAPAARGQPTTFAPGASNSVFKVELGIDQLVWQLGSNYITASALSPICPLACPMDCSGRGSCDTVTGTCACDAGWAGEDCASNVQINFITPTVQCVELQNDGSYLAYFGYINTLDYAVYQSVGDLNTLLPASANAPITTVFQPGTHGAAGDFLTENVFAASFYGMNKLKWMVGEQTAVASTSSPVCPYRVPISPLLDCVEIDDEETTITAHFGWFNPNSVPAIVAVGEQNSFTPAPADRGQGTVFSAGQTLPYPNTTFTVSFPFADVLTWTLTTHTVAASRYSAPCVWRPTAPFALSAILSNQLTSFTTTFDIPTNLAGATGLNVAGSCADVFASNTASLLGAGAQCTWISSSQVRTTFGTGFTATIGTELHFSPLILDASGTSKHLNNSVPLQMGPNPQQPMAAISAPATALTCHTFSLDGGASSAGGPITYAWSLINGADVHGATTQLAPQADKDVISFINLAPGAYTFGLTVYDNFGQMSSAQKSLQVNSGLNSFAITLDKPHSDSLTLGVSPTYAVLASVAFPCAADGSSLVDFSWTITPALSGSVISATSQLIIPTTLLTPQTYTLMVTVSLRSNPNIASTASVMLVVNAGAIIPSITGGGSMAVTAPISLGATVLNPNGPSVTTYAWSCTDSSNNPCMTRLNVPLVLAPTSIITIPGDTLWAGEYHFSVLVSASGQSVSASTNVLLTSAGATVSIAPVDNNIEPSSQLLVSASVVSSSSSPIHFVWSFDTTSGGSGSLGNILLAPSFCYPAGINSEDLLIAATCLPYGTTFALRLTVTQDGVTTSAVVTFKTTSVAPAGAIRATQGSGPTLYSFRATGFGGGSSVTYTYSYAFRSAPSVQVMLSTGPGATNQGPFLLPVGQLRIFVVTSTGGSAYLDLDVAMPLKRALVTSSDVGAAIQVVRNDISSGMYIVAMGDIMQAVNMLTQATSLSDTQQTTFRLQLVDQLRIVVTGYQSHREVVSALYTMLYNIMYSHESSALFNAVINLVSQIDVIVANTDPSALTQFQRQSGVSANVLTPTECQALAHVAGVITTSSRSTVSQRATGRSYLLRISQNTVATMVLGQTPNTISSVYHEHHVTIVRGSAIGGIMIGNFRLPRSFTITESSTVIVQQISYKRQPHTSDGVLSNVHSLSVHDGASGAELTVEGLTDQITVAIQITVATPSARIQCAYFDTTTQQYLTTGLTTTRYDTSVTCGTSHLTDFALVDVPVPVEPMPVGILAAILSGAGVVVVAAVIILAVCLRIRSKNQATSAVMQQQTELRVAKAALLAQQEA